MRILICGGRDFTDHELFIWAMKPFIADNTEVIHGNALGADSMAFAWGVSHNYRVHSFPADWETHGKSAGPIRNQQMLDEGKPDLVIAFPGGRGTADMVSRAKKAGIEVIEVRPEMVIE